MLEDLQSGLVLDPVEPSAEAAEKLVAERQPRFFTYRDWCRLDELEIERGKELDRPRVKFTSVEEMWNALEEVRSA